MTIDCNQVIERRGTGSAKWEYYPDGVLPMWVADMDFPSPAPVVHALQERAAHGFFGYSFHAPELLEVICARLERLYQWTVTPEQFVFLPSLVSGIHAVCRAIGEPGDSVLTMTPAYPPFLSAPAAHQRVCDTFELTRTCHDQTLSYEIDFAAFADAFHARTRMLLLCNPHNPVGITYDRTTLARIAELCLSNDTVICSDEIHCDLLLGEARHTPMATLSDEIAQRTITLMAPSKTFNLPGLGFSMAIVPNPELREQLKKASYGIVPHVNAMGLAGALAAYRDGQPWLSEVLTYLTANRDYYTNYIAEHMPQLAATAPEATYLGWIDCRAAGIEGSPYKFFLDEAKVALSDGAMFGPGGEGFVRINFACPRAILDEGLGRMRSALNRIATPVG